jgi:hypothetical protein
VPFDSSSGDSRAEIAGQSRGTILGQIGNGLPPGGANQRGGPGVGNGNQGPGGSGNQFGGMGQGTGGVCIAPIIQFEPNASAGLADRHDNSVSHRPADGRFFAD